MRAYLEMYETELLENAATCMRDKLLIRLLARLGCHVSEALALEVKDIDFLQATVTIEHLKSHIRLGSYFWYPRGTKPHRPKTSPETVGQPIIAFLPYYFL